MNVLEAIQKIRDIEHATEIVQDLDDLGDFQRNLIADLLDEYREALYKLKVGDK